MKTDIEMYKDAINIINREIDEAYELIDSGDSYASCGIDAWQKLAGIKGVLKVLEIFKEDKENRVMTQEDYENECWDKLIETIRKYNICHSENKITLVKTRDGQFIYKDEK